MHLPQEIVDLVVANLALDESATNADLARAALISRAWRIPSQRCLHRSQLFSPPHKRLLARLAWFQEADGQRVAHHVKEVQFWRLDGDIRQFCSYWKSVLGSFPCVQDVGIQFHDAALQGPLGPSNGPPLPTFPSVTTLRLSNVAFATCHNLLVLISTLPNVTSLYMDRENWACGDLLEEELLQEGSAGANHPKGPMCNGASCPLLPLQNIVIDCTGGLDLLECAVRHTDLSKLVSLDVALPADPRSSGAGMAPFLMGVPTSPKPDFPAQETQIQSLLCGMDALERMVFRVPSEVVCNPIIPRATPSLRHFALHYLRLDCFVPSDARPTLSCISDALAALVSPCLETVNITFSLSDTAQLDCVPWADIDRILSDPDAFPILRECAFNVVYLVRRGAHAEAGPEGKSPKIAAIAAIAAAVPERLPILSTGGVVSVHEAEDFDV
ncbi:hypothetical protein BC628DRAFT_1503442 [Trametes gibbosa]|nr:hypothetical protein BC628DRAFT_1503442 [Trametes gibbosa]